MSRSHTLVMGLVATLAASGGLAQTKAPVQVVKPPVAQLWIDIATATMPGMPDMSGMPGMASMPGMGGMPGMGPSGGAQSGGNTFGSTRSMSPGKYADIAFVTQRKPAGSEATQTVPAGTGLAPSLALMPVRAEPRGPGGPGEPGEYKQPKGRVLLYWGCSETVRAGQPRVLDFANAAPAEWGNFMQGRAPRERGAVARPGHSIWPNEKDNRRVGKDALLAGEHSLTGDGVPADLKFAIGQTHDFMAPIALKQTGTPADVVQLSWPVVPNARAYFINALSGGADPGGATELVLWSSAEVPDPGMALIDYASPANVEQWLREKVLLAPTVTQCAIPKGIFAKNEGAAMLRMIAYGPELNLAHPPRPTDVKIAWEPEWAVRVRTKSTAMAMLGMSMDAGATMGAAPSAAPSAGAQAATGARPDCPPVASGSDSTAAAVGGALGGSVGQAVGGALGGLFGKKPEKKEVPPGCPQ